MKEKFKQIKYKKERVILSDILPYEIPITFSNRHFYGFLTKHKIQFTKDEDKTIVTWEGNSPVLNNILKLLFDANLPQSGQNRTTLRPSSIPFNFKISHKENDFRALSIVHPKSQIAIISFYEKYKHLILHYCNLSPYSIRKTHQIAKYKYFRDGTHSKKFARDEEYEAFEEHDKEYEHLKTFFVYKNYSNIHKFYESYKYHRCEKKYNKLFKFDISKCFDSIYTHSINWALSNKEVTKIYLSESKRTFAGEFDFLMQSINYMETNGIVIGPEFSRIFAELILQRVDLNVFKLLQERKIHHKRDYEIFRYVDDYFVFYNEESTREEILKTFRLELKEFKLYLNDSKTQLYEKPIITEITIAKQKITDILNKYLVYQFEEKPKAGSNENPEGKEVKVQQDGNDGEIDKDSAKFGTIYVSSNKIITKIKTVIKETGVEYKDVLNYTLSLMDRRLLGLTKNYEEIEKRKDSEGQFTKAVLEILDITFFLYSVSPRVNTTIKLSRILRTITEFLIKRNIKNIDFKHIVLKKIFDNVYFTLEKNKSLEHTQVETLYLLVSLSELGKEYWLSEENLCSYFGIVSDESGQFEIKGTLNYFSITVLLFYMRNKKRYNRIRRFIKLHIIKKFRKCENERIGQNTELTLLLFDLIVCPYLDQVFKRNLLHLYGIKTNAERDSIIDEQKYWFTKWTDFDLRKELDAKQGQEVY